MKGLRKYLSPFAPDQSGASGVLYELGGILVICDAGGCTGNVCGFDEPRWFTRKSAVFSAGLRDMDAILGRDDRLVEKLMEASGKLHPAFAAIIGTPVPAVIGTDYRALKRMAQKRWAEKRWEKKSLPEKNMAGENAAEKNVTEKAAGESVKGQKEESLPVLTVDTNGMDLYDIGEEKAYMALFQTFATEKFPVEPGRIGVIGATPLNTSSTEGGGKLARALGDVSDRKVCGCGLGDVPDRKVCCYGMGAGLEEVRRASAAEENWVVAPSGLKAARYLEETFGTPYRIGYPGAETLIPAGDYRGKRILILHQQVLANALRLCLRRMGAADVTAAGWFMMVPELMEGGDVSLSEEDAFEELVREGGYDVVFADRAFLPGMKGFQGQMVPLTHFAVSGRLVD